MYKFTKMTSLLGLAAASILGTAIVQAQPPQVPPEQLPPNRQPNEQQTPRTDRVPDEHNTRTPPNRLDPETERTQRQSETDRERDREASRRGQDQNSNSARSSGETDAPHSQEDAQFVRDAMASGRTEIAMARLAQERASREEVKEFARELERDHTRLNGQLESLASSANQQGNAHAPGQPGTPGRMGQGTPANTPAGDAMGGQLQQLSSKSGADFDREFLSHQVRHHEESIRKFEAAANRGGQNQSGAGSTAATVAREALPVLKRHLQRAQSLSRDTAQR